MALSHGDEPPTADEWRRAALGLCFRVRQLEAERDGLPAPDPEDFTEEAWARRWEELKPDVNFFPW